MNRSVNTNAPTDARAQAARENEQAARDNEQVRLFHQNPPLVLPTHVAQPGTMSPSMAANIRATIECAGRLNRNGVMALTSGSIQSAVSAFRLGLEQLESLAPIVLTDAVVGQAILPPLDIRALGAVLVSKPGPMLRAAGIPAFQDDHIYLYGNALDFLCDMQHPAESGETETNTDTEEQGQEGRLAYQVSFYSSIIMFNLALAFHKRGRNCNHQRSLATAIRFYDMAMQTIGVIQINDYSDKLLLLMLSIWNNQSQIYFSMEHYEHAKMVLEGVRSLAATLLLERHTSLNEADQAHISEFMLNVITAKEPTNAACA